MSTFHGQTSPDAPIAADLGSESKGKGLAIAALACGIAGFCLPLVGIVGIVLGVIVLGKGATRWRGLALGGVVCGAVSMLVMVVAALLLALLLPALAKAREVAREVKSGTQMRLIAGAILDEGKVAGSLPAAGDDLQDSLAGTIDDAVWTSPRADDGLLGGSYLYLPPPKGAPEGTTPLLVERPEISARKLNVAYLDGHVESLPRADVELLLRRALPKVYTADGKPWTPQP